MTLCLMTLGRRPRGQGSPLGPWEAGVGVSAVSRLQGLGLFWSAVLPSALLAAAFVGRPASAGGMSQTRPATAGCPKLRPWKRRRPAVFHRLRCAPVLRRPVPRRPSPGPGHLLGGVRGHRPRPPRLTRGRGGWAHQGMNRGAFREVGRFGRKNIHARKTTEHTYIIYETSGRSSPPLTAGFPVLSHHLRRRDGLEGLQAGALIDEHHIEVA